MENSATEDQLEEHGKAIAAVDGVRPTGEPREDLINTATAFLLNPRVQQSTSERKRAFLMKKGLTPTEIDMAVERSLRPQHFSNEVMIAPPRSWLDMFGSAVMGIAVIGSAVYGAYWVFKTYIEPRLATNPSALEKSVDELVAAVRQLSEDRKASELRLDEQNVRLTQLLVDLRQDVTSLKGVLVARSQFPAAPVTCSIPSWQRTPVVINKVPSPPPSAIAPPRIPNGSLNGAVGEEDLKETTSTSLETAVSSSNGDHKESTEELKVNGEDTEKEQEATLSNPSAGESVISKRRRNGKNRKSDLEV